MTPNLAELRRLLDVNRERYFHALPWHAWDRGIGYELHVGATCRDEMEPRGYCEGVNNGFRETFGAPEVELIVAAVNALPGLLGKADALLDAADSLAHMTEARDNARAEVERLTAMVERVRALHPREVIAVHEFGPEAWCPTCELHYPCPTVRALDEEPQP